MADSWILIFIYDNEIERTYKHIFKSNRKQKYLDEMHTYTTAHIYYINLIYIIKYSIFK